MSDLPNPSAQCRRRLLERLRETAPGCIQLLTGPRQVGKTTLLLEIAEQFGEDADYAAGDEPDAALPGFWERRWAEAEDRARRGRLSCSSMKSIAWATGPPGSRGSGTFCNAGTCVSMLSRLALLPYA